MTRVAPVDEKVWAELYLLNRENLGAVVGRIVARLRQFRDALSSGDEERLLSLQREGKSCFQSFFQKN